MLDLSSHKPNQMLHGVAANKPNSTPMPASPSPLPLLRRTADPSFASPPGLAQRPVKASPVHCTTAPPLCLPVRSAHSSQGKQVQRAVAPPAYSPTRIVAKAPPAYRPATS